MSLSLSRQMTGMLEDALRIVQTHHQPILQEWEMILSRLNGKDGRIGEELDFAVSFLSHFLVSDKNKDVEQWISDIRESWQHTFQHPPEPNRVIIIATILENAVHKALQDDIGQSYREHQAIQYLFSQITEQILSYPFKEQLNLGEFLKQITASRQLPVEWVARVEIDETGYNVIEVIGDHTSFPRDRKDISGSTLFALSESLLNGMPTDEAANQKIFPVPWNDETLLFCTKETNASAVLPFITFSLQTLKSGRDALRFSNQEQQWKDAVILFNEWIMRSQSLNDAIEKITFGFVNYLPFERCALFGYSDNERKGFGLFSYHLNTKEIKNIEENIDNIPSIEKGMRRLQSLEESLKNIQPIYVQNALNGFPDRYVREFQLESVVIAPIYVPSENKLIGAAILDKGPGKRFKVSRETFTALMKFGQSAGEILTKVGWDQSASSKQSSSFRLSRREIEVLELMAEGASTTEAADKLNLSEYTVRDYISSIIKKMNVRNRTEAAVKAIREGVI